MQVNCNHLASIQTTRDDVMLHFILNNIVNTITSTYFCNQAGRTSKNSWSYSKNFGLMQVKT